MQFADARQVTGTGTECHSEGDFRVIGFPDIDPIGRPAQAMLSELEKLLPGRVSTAQWQGADFANLSETLKGLERDTSRLICLGIGAGARAALLHGPALGAERIIAWAPTGSSPVDGQAFDAAHDPVGGRGSDPPAPSVHLISGADTWEADLELVRRFRDAAAGIRLERLEAIPYCAIEDVLARTGFAADLLTAFAAGLPLPKHHGLYRRWHSAFAHRIELEASQGLARERGLLELRGVFHNASSHAFNLNVFERDLVRIGARIFTPGDPPDHPRSSRFTFGNGVLAPGAALPFRLPLPKEVVQSGFVAHVALVRDGRFWFDDHGFASQMVSVPASERPVSGITA